MYRVRLMSLTFNRSVVIQICPMTQRKANKDAKYDTLSINYKFLIYMQM